MLKQVTTKNFAGFGNDGRPGSHYFSINMTKSQYGIVPGWSNSSSITNGDTGMSSLGIVYWLTQQKFSSTNYVFALCGDNKAFFVKDFAGIWALAYKSGQTGANGMIGDQKSRVLYAQDRYLGKYDGTANYTTGTVSVTNGSAAIVGTGTTFAASDVDKMFSVDGLTFYRISAYTDATHITLASNYTGSTNATASYAIYRGWDDKWKDFGSSVANTTMPMELYEDVTLVGRNNNICRLNDDDSVNDDASPAIGFPTNFVCRAIKAGKNGVLLGFNINNKGVIALWDNYSDRSIAPWIWYDSNIQSIVFDGNEWIVITTNSIHATNGYTSRELVEGIDSTQVGSSITCAVQGALVIKNWLLIANTGGTLRSKSGIQAFNLKTGLVNYIPVQSKYMYNCGVTALLYDSGSTLHSAFNISHPTGSPTYHIGTVYAGSSSSGTLVTEPLGTGNNIKYAKAVKLDLGIYDRLANQYPLSFNIAVKVAPQNRQLWNYTQANATASAANKVRVDGSVAVYANAQVGDEVTILNGTNAGEVRHITAIANSGTNTEEWTVDTAFSNATESATLINVAPFSLCRRVTISSGYTLEDMWFDLQKNVKGKNFYVKVVIDTITNTVPEILGVTLIYDEVGALQ